MKRRLAQIIWDITEWLPLPEIIEWNLSEWAWCELNKKKGKA